MKINWKQVIATLTSALTILAALPYQLGDISTIVPAEWKSKIVVIGLVATTILRVWNGAKPPPPPVP
jgi:hypothetical protein